MRRCVISAHTTTLPSKGLNLHLLKRATLEMWTSISQQINDYDTVSVVEISPLSGEVTHYKILPLSRSASIDFCSKRFTSGTFQPISAVFFSLSRQLSEPFRSTGEICSVWGHRAHRLSWKIYRIINKAAPLCFSFFCFEVWVLHQGQLGWLCKAKVDAKNLWWSPRECRMIPHTPTCWGSPELPFVQEKGKCYILQFKHLCTHFFWSHTPFLRGNWMNM